MSYLEYTKGVEVSIYKAADAWDQKTTNEHLLNQGQKKAFDTIHKFFFSSFWRQGEEVKFYVLMGEAGTGKSFLTTTVIQDVLLTIRNHPEKLAVVAPTHKAVGVLRNYSPVRHHPKLNILTLASLCGVKPVENHRDGTIDFIPSFEGSKVPEYRYIIVDEVSMINKQLLNILVKAAIAPHGPKVLLIGDPSQLPPVMEGKNAACFVKSYWEQKGVKVMWSKLTEQMRTSEGDAIHAACLDARKGGPGSLKKAQTTKVGTDSTIVQIPYGLKNSRDLDPLLLKLFGGEDFKRNPDFAKVIAFTKNATAKNPAVPQWNRRIRRVIYGAALDAPDAAPVFEGEAIRLDKPLSEEVGPGVAGDTVKYNTDHSFWVYGVDKTTIKTPMMDLLFDGKYQEPFKAFELLVRTRYAVAPTNEKEKIRIIDPTEMKRFAAYHKRLLNLAKVTKNSSPKNAKPLWTEYYYWMKAGFAFWSHDYARNVHTAQGSSYDVVLVDGHDMARIIDPNVRRKGMYVALSRAKQLLFWIGDKG